MSWPPTLNELKTDQASPAGRTADDAALRMQLAAAVAFVERVHRGRYNFDPLDMASPLPMPGSDMELGTVRLAGRWFDRRRSPDGLIPGAPGGEFGATRVSSGDADIDRQLRIGRFARAVIA
jgi:hypothetical protein